MSDQVTVLPPWTAGVSTTPAVLLGVDPALLRQWPVDAQTAYRQMSPVDAEPDPVTAQDTDGLRRRRAAVGDSANGVRHLHHVTI
jgi:hypothetical protein